VGAKISVTGGSGRRGLVLAIVTIIVIGVVAAAVVLIMNPPGGNDEEPPQVEDIILVQSDLPTWNQVGGIEAGAGNSLYTRYNMTQAAGCQFGSCNLTGPNVTLMIELFQFQSPENTSTWLNDVHLPRLIAFMNESTDTMSPSSPDGNGTLIHYVAYDGKNDGWDLAFHQGEFVCRVMIIAPTGTPDIEGLVNDIAEAQNDKILKAIA
jgi:hypothetical protein